MDGFAVRNPRSEQIWRRLWSWLWPRLSISARHSVRGKILAVVAWTSTTALITAATALLAHDIVVYRQAQSNALETEARILALSTAPALAFDDQRTALQALDALAANQSLLAAALYGPNGFLYARYVRAGAAVPPMTAALRGTTLRVTSQAIEVTEPVLQGAERLGTVYLRARYDFLAHLLADLGILVVVILGSLALALVLSSVLHRAITQPLDAMAEVSRQIIEHRDYSLRAERSSDDEIGVVVRAFNKMLDEVQTHVNAREEAHAAVNASMQVARRTAQELRVTEAALREANQRKDVFIATLAHELRNPLAPIRIAARLLASPALKPEELANTRAIIGRQVQHMALLLDDLLDVSRITRGALELKRDYVALDSCIAAAIETARPVIDAKRHQLTLVSPPEPIVLYADPVRVTQVITNLLTNAAKYTDPEGEIVLTSRLENERVVISVKDSGIGIPSEALPKLFEMFTQLQSAGERTSGGLGIGLALVKGLVQLHGGEVEVRSAGVNQGSEFVVRLPALVVRHDPLPLFAEPDAAPAARGRRILVADDNEDAAQSLAMLLRNSGHEVRVVFSGPDALAAAAQDRPDVMLLDIGMPGLSGYQVARALRQQGVRATLVAITGWGQESDRRRADEAGFDHHMTKPIDPLDLERYLLSLDNGNASNAAV